MTDAPDDQPPETAEEGAHPRVAIVTGPAGAGRTTAIRAFEDIGFEVIDNLPLALLARVVAPQENGAVDAQPSLNIAIGIDSRTRGFSPTAVVAAMDELKSETEIAPVLLYLDCSETVLLNRFNETRRRHPLAGDAPVVEGVEAEREALAPLRDAADIVIDTTEMTPHDLKAAVAQRFTSDHDSSLAVTVQSFSFKRGAPKNADMVLDVRFLSNPHWRPELRPLDGRDPRVAAYVEADPAFDGFFDRLLDLLLLLLPAYKREGKSYLMIAIGCTGGKHRSVMIADRLARRLATAGWSASLRHRELSRIGQTSIAHPDGASVRATSGAHPRTPPRCCDDRSGDRRAWGAG